MEPLSFVTVFTRAHHWPLSWARWILYSGKQRKPTKALHNYH